MRVPEDETLVRRPPAGWSRLPPESVQVVPGSSWGTFTIACTIPIALFVGLYMYKIRKGAVVEASLIGAAATLAAVVAGNYIPGSALEPYFSLTKTQTILALTGYGFIASVLPVWMLLCPRDYLSSFLKIGTIALLVVGVCVANPVLACPMVNPEFADGGPTFPWGGIFPFVFICIMCGAVSGFHALVSSGTTPKMVEREIADPRHRLRGHAHRGAGRRRRPARRRLDPADALLRHQRRSHARRPYQPKLGPAAPNTSARAT